MNKIERHLSLRKRHLVGLEVCIAYTALLTVGFIVFAVQQNHTMQSLDQKYSALDQRYSNQSRQMNAASHSHSLRVDAIETKSLIILPYNGKSNSGGIYIDSNGLFVHSGNSNASTSITPGIIDLKQNNALITLRPQNQPATSPAAK